jgi:hypothetical protein
MRGRARKALVAVAAASLVAVPILTGAGGVSATVAGAGFTTYVAGDEADCFDSPNGIDCNNYADKDSVYMSGGPSAAGLSNGLYYFAVLTPGAQNGGFIDGTDGNLSDLTAGATLGDAGTGDDVSNRTFRVANHEITVYNGTHATGNAPNGRFIIGLAPFDDTSNAGGVYILAICQTGATSPSQCKYDAFRVREDGTVTPQGVLSGSKYYDANENGQRDPNEVGIAGWPITITDGITYNLTTDGNGDFSQSNIPADNYTVAETQANSPWVETGNTVDQSSSSGGNFVTSLSGFIYSVTVADGTTSGLNFGNVCRLTPGGLTIGFWSNKNGQALITQADIDALNALNLRDAAGNNKDFTGSLATAKSAYKSWLLSATATNMAYMLSAQLSATVLNIRHGFTNGTVVVGSDGTVQDVVNAANALLANPIASGTFAGQNGGLTVAASALRTEQERLKNILDKTNNGGAFTQPTQGTCPTPVFP